MHLHDVCVYTVVIAAMRTSTVVLPACQLVLRQSVSCYCASPPCFEGASNAMYVCQLQPIRCLANPKTLSPADCSGAAAQECVFAPVRSSLCTLHVWPWFFVTALQVLAKLAR